MATAEKLKERLLKGAIEPSSEGEIPRLIHGEASSCFGGFLSGFG